MPSITLPDGSVRDFDGAVTGRGVAADISKSLEKAAVCVRVDGELRDLDREIDNDASVEIAQFSVYADANGGFLEALADVGGDGATGDSGVEVPNGAVRQGDTGHGLGR